MPTRKGVITVCYKHGEPLDEEYYTTKHVAIVGRVWAPLGMERAEIRKLTAAGDGSAPPYGMVASAYFPSLEAAKSVLANPASAEVVGDIKNYYKGQPDLFLGEVYV